MPVCGPVEQVAESLRYLHSIYLSIDHATMDLMERNLDLLIEMAEGNPANQVVLFDNKGKIINAARKEISAPRCLRIQAA